MESDALQNLEKGGGGGGNGKSYEITQFNQSKHSTSQNTIYGLLAALGIAILILLGYLKGVRE